MFIQRFHVSTILKGGVVTEMVWDGDTRLFYGDNQGQVALAFIPKVHVHTVRVYKIIIITTNT